MKLSELIEYLIGFQELTPGEDPKVMVADWWEDYAKPTELTSVEICRLDSKGENVILLQDRR